MVRIHDILVWIRIRIRVTKHIRIPEPDPDPHHLPVLRIRIRIHMFLDLLDPDLEPEVWTDPDPSFIMQKQYVKPLFLLFWDFFWIFILKNDINVASKSQSQEKTQDQPKRLVIISIVDIAQCILFIAHYILDIAQCILVIAQFIMTIGINMNDNVSGDITSVTSL